MFIKFKYNNEELIGYLSSIVEEGDSPFIYKPYSSKPLRTNSNLKIGTWGRFDEFKKLTDGKIDFNEVAPTKLYWIKIHFLSWGVDEYYLVPKNKVIEYDVSIK